MEVKASRATEVTAKGATNGNRNGKGTMEENTNGATASDSQDEQAVTCFESFDDMQLAEVSQGQSPGVHRVPVDPGVCRACCEGSTRTASSGRL